jgi:hypothetical protein
MVKDGILDDDELTVIADNDRLQFITIKLTEALLDSMRCVAWPGSPEVRKLGRRASAARQSAADIAARLVHPRRITGIDLGFMFDAVCGQIRNDHVLAVAMEPDSPEAKPPRPLPAQCPLSIHRLLDADGIDIDSLFG